MRAAGRVGRRRRAHAPLPRGAHPGRHRHHGPRRGRAGPASRPDSDSRARAGEPPSAQLRRAPAQIGRAAASRRPARLAGHRVAQPQRGGVQPRAAHRQRRPAPRRSARRRRPGGRWPRGGPGSGGSARSRAGTRAATRPPGRGRWRSPRSGCGPPCPRAETVMRVGSRAERPDGRVDHAAQRLELAPHQGQVAPLDLVRGRAGRPGRRRRSGVRATSSRPEVPLSRRCTMPGRAGSPTAASSGIAGQQALHQRARAGCRRRGARPGPAGLSTTMRSSSA